MMNPTWTSDSMVLFSAVNRECPWGDSTVLYLLILSAFGSERQLKALFIPLPKASGECEIGTKWGNLFNSGCRRRGRRPWVDHIQGILYFVTENWVILLVMEYQMLESCTMSNKLVSAMSDSTSWVPFSFPTFCFL